MTSTFIQQRPLVLSLLAIVAVYLINQVPISDLLMRLLPEFEANMIENILFNGLAIGGIFYLIKRSRIAFHFSGFHHKAIPYYLPLIVYLIIFSGGLAAFKITETRAAQRLSLFTVETLSAALLEEMLFRALILGLCLRYYHQKESGVLKALILSSIFFGCTHLLNLWSDPNPSLKQTLNQIYATTCLGFMYASVYVKTRSLLVLTLLHAISNFLAALPDLGGASSQLMNTVIEKEGLLEIIVEEILRLNLFGIPLLIGLFIYSRVHSEDVAQLRPFKNPSQHE